MVSVEDVVGLFRLLVQGASTARAALSGQSLAAAVAGRVYATAPLDADAATLPRPCVVVDLLGGDGDDTGTVQNLTLHLYAYSDAGQGQATALYEALRAELEGARLVDPAGAITAAGYARESARPDIGHNDVMKSYYARGTWEAHVAG